MKSPIPTLTHPLALTLRLLFLLGPFLGQRTERFVQRTVPLLLVDAQLLFEPLRLPVALPSWQDDINRVVEALARTAASHVQALQRIDLTFDTTGLNRVFQDLEAWQRLDTGQRAVAARVLDDAYRHASPDLAAEALVAGLEDTARSFASAQSSFLSPELQRQLFVWFFGLLTLAVLMQAPFSSETADAVIEKVAALSPAAVLAMTAADKAWEKGTRRPEGDEEGEEKQD